MITDANLTLSGSYTNGVWTGQSVAAVVSTLTSTNVIDLASMTGGPVINQPSDFGAGKLLICVFNILVTVTGGASTIAFQLVDADDAAISVNVNVINQTDALPIANLTAGTIVPLELDRVAPYVPRRYLAARYVIAGATTTAGTVAANLVETVDDVTLLGKSAYKGGFVVL